MGRCRGGGVERSMVALPAAGVPHGLHPSSSLPDLRSHAGLALTHGAVSRHGPFGVSERLQEHHQGSSIGRVQGHESIPGGLGLAAVPEDGLGVIARAAVVE